MKKLLFVFIFICAFLNCCKQVPNSINFYETEILDDSIKRMIIHNIDENNVLKFSDIFDSIIFIRLETTNNSLIGTVDKLISIKDKYIILDAWSAKGVFVFDEFGNFLNRIGSSGKGPEEFDVPLDIAYDKYNDELLVLDRNRKRIMRFQINGKFVGDIKLSWWASAIWMIAKNQYLLYLNNVVQENGKPSDYNIHIVNSEGESVSQMMPFDENTGKLSPPTRKIFSFYKNQTIASPSYGNRIYEILDNQLNIKYYLDFGKRAIPSSLFNNTTSRELMQEIDKSGMYVYNSSSVETSSHVISELIYKRKVFYCYYSKVSETCKISSAFFNDIYALASMEGRGMTTKGDSLICVIDVDVFYDLQKSVRQAQKNNGNYKKLMLSALASSGASVLNRQLRNNYEKAVESSNITLSNKEAEFILSIKEEDNPIIRIAKLKKF